MSEALREAERQHAESLARLQHTIDYSRSGLHASLLANGGALIALFSLIAPQRDLAAKLWGSGLAFAIGMSLTLAAWIAATLAQDRFQILATKNVWNEEARAAEREVAYDVARDYRLGMRLVVAAYTSVTIAVLGFIVGCLLALRALA